MDGCKEGNQGKEWKGRDLKDIRGSETGDGWLGADSLGGWRVEGVDGRVHG